MDLSLSLITKVIDDQAIREVNRSGITKDFIDQDYVPVWNYVQKFYSDHKGTPSREAVLRAFPSLEFVDAAEPLNYYISELQETHRRSILEDSLTEAVQAYNKDTKEAESILRSTLAALRGTTTSHKDINLAASALDAIAEYEKRKENPGATGILSGWSKMDYQTLGWQPEEFIVIVGEKYMGKSWIMIWLAYQAAKQGERVLFVTKEMAPDATQRRFNAVYSGVNFDKLRRGELDANQESKFKAGMEKMSNSNIQFVIARDGITTIEDIERKALEMDASIIFGDSIYLFDPSENYKVSNKVQRLGDISTKCKNVATNLSIPFIVTVQAGRKKSKERIPTLDDIEWSNAFSQDADTCFFLEKSEVDEELDRAQILLLKSRDGDKEHFFINVDKQNARFDQNNEAVEPKTNVFEEQDEGVFS